MFAAAQIALSAGLVGREPAARSWAIVYFCALAANSFSTMAFPNAMRELQLQAASFLHIGLAEEVSAPGLAAAMIAGAAALVPVWFLARKNAFRRPPSAVRQ